MLASIIRTTRHSGFTRFISTTTSTPITNPTRAASTAALRTSRPRVTYPIIYPTTHTVDEITLTPPAATTTSTTTTSTPQFSQHTLQHVASQLWKTPATQLGAPLPASPHACSVSMPQWSHVVGYEEGDAKIHGALQAGYPRFVIHRDVQRLFDECTRRYAAPGELCFAFPTHSAASHCLAFLQSKMGFGIRARVIPYGVDDVCAVVFPTECRIPVKQYWQHFGNIISSRYAQDVLAGTTPLGMKSTAWHTLLQHRIAHYTETSYEDVYLYPSGMSAISNAIAMAQAIRPGAKSIQFGFPYLDALKLQRVCGPGHHFFPNTDDHELDAVERLIASEPISVVFAEYPGNPLLKTCNIPRLSAVCRKHGVPLIVDDTVASFAHTRLFPYADVIVSSLTKWFSGCGDVMAGSMCLSTTSPLYSSFKSYQHSYTQQLYPGDAMILEQNSRDFGIRMNQITNTMTRVCDVLSNHPAIERLYAPDPSKIASDINKTDGARIGGMFSLVLCDKSRTIPFYDKLAVCKGPSLGTNFTLACPYTILAHYDELEWAESVGISRHLVRISVGLEDAEDLIQRLEQALPKK